jgi:hypothetical protein
MGLFIVPVLVRYPLAFHAGLTRAILRVILRTIVVSRLPMKTAIAAAVLLFLAAGNPWEQYRAMERHAQGIAVAYRLRWLDRELLEEIRLLRFTSTTALGP